MSASHLSMTAVLSRFPSPSQTFIRRKLDGLRDAGVRVEVASTNFHDGAEATGFPLLPLAPWQHPGELRTARGRRAWGSLVRTYRPAGPRVHQLRDGLLAAPLLGVRTDIVHFEFSGIAVTYLDALDELGGAHRLAVSCRGAAEQVEPLNDPTRARHLAEVFDRMHLIHCVSDDMARTVVELGAPPDRILVNRPAVPVARFAPLRGAERSHGPLRVLSVGRLHWKKGLDDGMRAVAAARALGTDVRYRIVGEGPEREKLSFLVDQLGLGAHVELLGARTEQEVLDELAGTDVLLLPSLSEGISNAVLEAMAAGRAVITTDCGGMTEVVHDGDDGLVVGVGEVTAMAAALARLAEDEDLRSALGDAAARTADRELDISRQVRVFVGAYQDLTGT